MTDYELVLQYAPRVHFDHNETIPLRAVGYTLTREPMHSDSFPKRHLLPPKGGFTIEYAYYWDYDIQHMYDLEHTWVNVNAEGKVVGAEGSFHGGFIPMYAPQLRAPDGTHVHADSQPGKHAFALSGQMFRILPDWQVCCNRQAAGTILVGGPFGGAYAPTEKDNELANRYVREHLTFEPTMVYDQDPPADVPYMPWPELKAKIPTWIRAEIERLHDLYKE